MGDKEESPQGKGQVPEGNEKPREKKQSPEGKKENPQGNEKKKFKSKAFPLGTSEEKSETPEGNEVPKEVPSGDQPTSSGDKRKSSDLSEALKETPESPSGEKEAKMPLDEEGKEFVREAVKVGTQPLKEKLEVVDKVHQALETIKEKLASTPSATETKGTPLSEEQVALKAADIIRKEQEKERKAQEDDEAKRKENEKQQEFRDWCLRNPEATECKDMGEFVTKVAKQVVKESSQTKKEEPETPKAGTQPESLEQMTDEKRDGMTEEQNQARDIRVKAIVDQFNISANDEARNILKDPTNKENLIKKAELREGFIKSVTDDETLEIVKARCEGDACQVKFREGGIAVFKLGDNGKWVALDKEVAKQMKPLF